MIERMILVLISFIITLNADANIASKIQRLNTLPKTERFRLMNEIKRDLVRLNSTQRSEAIGKLRSAMRGKAHGKHKGMHNGNGKKQHLGNSCPNNQVNSQNTQEHKKSGSQKHKNQPKNRPNHQNNSKK